jgi:hypothetical protein
VLEEEEEEEKSKTRTVFKKGKEQKRVLKKNRIDQ